MTVKYVYLWFPEEEGDINHAQMFVSLELSD